MDSMTDQPADDHKARSSCQPPPGEEVRDSSAQLARFAQRGKRYQRQRMTLVATEWTAEAAILMALLVLGWSVALREAVAGLTRSPWLVVLLYLAAVGLLLGLVSMVFSAARTFIIDRRFGLSTQSPHGWLSDELKGLAVGGLLTLIAVEILYALLRRFPGSWWIWAGGAFSILFIFLASVAPVTIFPLFFRFTRITNGEIRERLEQLAKRAGTRIEGVYEVNLSRKSRAANAALVGLGRTRRIVLADNLLDNFTLDEIEAVLAHEFGHHVQRHPSKIITIQTVAFFLVFYGVHRALGAVGERWGLQGAGDIANLPLVALAAAALGLVFLPVTNGMLRHFERRADEYALRLAARPRAFCSALQRLAQINLADRSPNALIEWIFYSHPAIDRRIKRAETILRGASNKEVSTGRIAT